MDNLEPFKWNSTYWAVRITRGPSRGRDLGKRFDLKRDAIAYIRSVEHLPWDQVLPTFKEMGWEPIVTVVRGQIEDLQAEVARLRDYYYAAQMVLIMVNGSGDAMAKAKRGENIDTIWVPQEDAS